MYRRRLGRSTKNARRKVNKLLRQLERDVSKYRGRCLFVTGDNGEYCNQPVSNNCHIVSKSAVLNALRDDKTKKVRELQWGVSPWRELVFGDDVVKRVQDTSTFDPEERPTDLACAGRFACSQRSHDNEFQRIDVAVPDFNDPEVRFLSGYRLVLFLADQCRKALRLRRPWDQTVKDSPMHAGRDLWFEEKEKVEIALRRAQADVGLLGKTWYARKTGRVFNLAVVSVQVLDFRSNLTLAGGVSYGNATGVTVFPIQGDLHKMAVLYLTSNSDLAGQDVKRLAAVASNSITCGKYGVSVTKELMSNGWGSLVVSPRSYNALREQDRFTIQSLVAQHTQDSEFVKSFFSNLA